MKNSFYASVLATIALTCPGPVSAEDIDLFVQPQGMAVSVPNVLILLDNTANWSRTVDGQAIYLNEIAALVTTVNNFAVNADGTAKFRVGLMLFTESGAGNSNADGGYVRAAVRDMTEANQATYMALLNSLDSNADKSNGGKAGKTFSEAYQYFSGLPPFSGNNKNKTDYTGNNTGTAASNAIYALPGNALNAKAGSPYNSPIAPDSCARNYIIYISNGAVQDNSSDNTTARNQLSAAATAEGITGATTALPISPSGSASNIADEWARFMHRSSKNIVTYTVDVDKIATGQGPGWSALLRSIANVSDGKYFSVTSGNGGATIADALEEIFTKIQAVNSVFASVSLPVSVNTEGTYLNQVYIGMFRPDADAYPRWTGNLKQYKLARIGDNLRTVDAYDYPDTIDPLTGFIDPCARSYWTPAAMDAYWQFRPQGTCSLIPAIGATPAEPLVNAANSNRPDGNIVEKGAQGYKLRSTIARTLKTCSATFASCNALTDFNNVNVTQAMLGAASVAERDALIDWAKGLDVDDEDVDAVTAAEMRPSAHGDVVHSRPVAIDFRTPAEVLANAAPRVAVIYGGNDGVLRAINGNRTAAVGTVDPGAEYWAFMPPEFYPLIKPLRDNSTQVDYEGNPTVPVQPKPYGIDGPITVHRDDPNIWIYPAMRRGGRALYAFNISGMAADPSVAPTLKWKKGCPNLGNDTDCSVGFEDIGQTWSAPRVFKAGGYGAGASPMLIMGGGYDPCEDSDPHSCVDASKGNKIYVLDADTGALLKTFDTDRAVVGDVVLSVNPATKQAIWGYAADMGGNVYRISGGPDTPNAPIGLTAPADWTITKIAALGCSGPDGACDDSRKFMFAPGLINENGTYVLVLGSGDREKPLRDWDSAYATDNYFFMFRDVPNDADWLADEDVNCDGSDLVCLDSLLEIPDNADPDAVDLSEKKGWYLRLRDHEQVVTSAITVFGTTTFSTHTPVPAVAGCVSNLGTARVYNVSYKNAHTQNGTDNRSEEISGGGLPPSPVAGRVTLDDGTTVPFLIGGDPDSPLQGLLPSGPAVPGQPKAVTYWYIHK